MNSSELNLPSLICVKLNGIFPWKGFVLLLSSLLLNVRHHILLWHRQHSAKSKINTTISCWLLFYNNCNISPFERPTKISFIFFLFLFFATGTHKVGLLNILYDLKLHLYCEGWIRGLEHASSIQWLNSTVILFTQIQRDWRSRIVKINV